MQNIKIHENFLLEEEFKHIQKHFLSDLANEYVNTPQLNWHLTPILDEKETICKPSYNKQLTHVFYDHNRPMSHMFDLLNPLLKNIQIKSLIRIKANLLFKTHKKITHGMHNDVDFNCTTAVFYINSNNGETVFENGDTVKSKANTLVEFPSSLKHSGTTNDCEEPYRVVLNLNYF
jgi:hypothetical protein